MAFVALNFERGCLMDVFWWAFLAVDILYRGVLHAAGIRMTFEIVVMLEM